MPAEIFPRGVFAALKTELEGAALLPYVDTVAIRQYRPNQLPDFTNYCIVISPEAATSETYGTNQKWIKFEITLVCLIKVNYTLEDAVMGDSPGDSPPKVGILAMYEDIYQTLYQNDLSETIEHYPGLQELDNRCDFKLIGDESREDFIVEGRLYYSPYGHRFISPTT
jgi:hypothetical protein